MKHSAIWKFWFGAALMLFAVLAQAAVSQIHTLSGTVSITYAGQAARAAQKGDRLESGTQVATGEKSFAMLRFEDGQIVAVQVEDLEPEATLKVLRRSNRALELHPANSQYAPLIFKDAGRSKVTILGRLVGVIRPKA